MANTAPDRLDHPTMEKTRASPPGYGNESTSSGAATSSPWNDSGFAFPPSTNTMDRNTMPSDTAEAARQKSAQVMAALRDGKPGDADKAMGDAESKGTKGVFPLRHFMGKLSGSGKKQEKKESVAGGDGVIR